MPKENVRRYLNWNDKCLKKQNILLNTITMIRQVLNGCVNRQNEEEQKYVSNDSVRQEDKTKSNGEYLVVNKTIVNGL